MNGPLLQALQLSKRYDAADADVLVDVSFELDAGQSLAIVGPSGCGKSTLLHILGTLDEPTGGRRLIDGDDPATMAANQRAALRNRRIGFVFQTHHLLPQLTALENTLVPTLADEDRARRRDAPQRARQLLERVGLGERMNHRPGQLSIGQGQRVALVRALINRPQALLADEPTGSLDGRTAQDVTDLLLQLSREEGLALVVATHATALAARMDRVATLRDGVLHDGGPTR